MTGRLITLPVRLSLRATAALARGAAEVAGRALSAVEDRRRAGHRAPVATAPPATAPAPAVAPTAPPASPAAPPAGAPAPLAGAPAPRAGVSAPPGPPPFAPIGTPPPGRVASPDEPVHVSEEPELVAEVAEPGAEEGAGAQLTVLEPWDGYAQMNVRDIVARLATSNDTELAAVELYEQSHRRRRTVLAAVQRRLRT